MRISVLSNINSIFNSVTYRIGQILVDPGDEFYGFQNIKAVLLTHAHFDHIYGLNRVVELNRDCMVFTNQAGADMLADPRRNLSKYHESPFIFQYPQKIKIVKEGDFMEVDGLNVKVYETPGHNPSCLTFIINDNVFSGDAYIPGIKTITNLPDGNQEQALVSMRRIVVLAEGKALHPGHPRLKILGPDRRPLPSR